MKAVIERSELTINTSSVLGTVVLSRFRLSMRHSESVPLSRPAVTHLSCVAAMAAKESPTSRDGQELRGPTHRRVGSLRHHEHHSRRKLRAGCEWHKIDLRYDPIAAENRADQARERFRSLLIRADSRDRDLPARRNAVLRCSRRGGADG